MSQKEDKLKPRLLDALDRMQRLIELNAPAGIIGAAAFHVYKTTLAVYGEAAGNSLIHHLRESALQARGVCVHEDCINNAERPDVGMCDSCKKELGIDDASLDVLFKEQGE